MVERVARDAVVAFRLGTHHLTERVSGDAISAVVGRCSSSPDHGAAGAASRLWSYSIDGYVADREGEFAWAAPTEAAQVSGPCRHAARSRYLADIPSP